VFTQAAEKQHKYFRKVNATKRQNLIKFELESELLQKDPYEFGILNSAYGKEHFPKS
jgi:hypothetical protein